MFNCSQNSFHPNVDKILDFFLKRALFLITEVEVKINTTTYTQRNKTRMSYSKEFKKFAVKRRDKARLILASITKNTVLHKRKRNRHIEKGHYSTVSAHNEFAQAYQLS